jgi:ubiquinone biosynthesis protein
MAANLGPAAKFRESVGRLIETVENLPKLVRDVETVAETLRSGGLKLHPDSLRALNGGGRGSGLIPAWLPWVLVVVLAYFLISR